jgi:hypothetical protein
VVRVLAHSDPLLVQGKKRQVTYKEWNDLIQSSFEKCYYIPEGEHREEDDAPM